MYSLFSVVANSYHRVSLNVVQYIKDYIQNDHYPKTIFFVISKDIIYFLKFNTNFTERKLDFWIFVPTTSDKMFHHFGVLLWNWGAGAINCNCARNITPG